MRRTRKVLLVSVALILLLQIPFAYRRYKLYRLENTIQQINANRKTSESNSSYQEYQGVAHVHSFLGGHSVGTFSEIIAAAQANHLQFVIMTEHTEKDFNTAEMTLKGEHGGVLFVNGNEVNTGSDGRLLVIPGDPDNSADSGYSQRRQRGQVVIVAYPEKFKEWESIDRDGVEVYNVYSNARQINPVVAFFDGLWSHRSYPDLIFANYYTRPNESLKQWDKALAHQRTTALAGNDSHANIGVSLNDGSGKMLLGLQLDPYRTSFHLVRMHVLIPKVEPLTQQSLVQAITAGHCFLGFDLFGDTSGFLYTVANGLESKIQGDEIKLQPNTRLHVSVPISSRVVVFRNGVAMADNSDVNFKDIPVSEPGIYRVEVYLPQLGKPVSDQPWIISNPIYVR